jgi:NTP pyrophosphatase (non-canonical NTP hydrolase)
MNEELMNIISYQIWTDSTAVYPEANLSTEREFNYLQHGAAGETGETSGYWKKLIRAEVVSLDRFSKLAALEIQHRQKLLAEMGDELWYLARKCTAMGLTLEELADLNVAKLEQRKAEGQLGAITR